MTSLRTRLETFALLPLWAIVACAPADGGADGRRAAPIVVYVAASLAAPLRAMATDFERETGIPVQLESGGSLDHARKITELERVPDLLVLADHDVFPQLLVPEHASWYLPFARNRMVIAYTDESRRAGEITPTNWREVLSSADVEVGRPDPARAPAGYRALMMLQLAARHYRDPGLEKAVLARAPARNVRPNAAELAALLELGEVDYIIEYESLARARGFRFITLPAAIDLGDASHAEGYAAASVRVPGRSLGDSITLRGSPILYALTVPLRAPHREGGERFAALLLGALGTAHLRDAHVDVLHTMRAVGSGLPAVVDSAIGATAR